MSVTIASPPRIIREDVGRVDSTGLVMSTGSARGGAREFS
jgi:hypothetical protein